VPDLRPHLRQPRPQPGDIAPLPGFHLRQPRPQPGDVSPLPGFHQRLPLISPHGQQSDNGRPASTILLDHRRPRQDRLKGPQAKVSIIHALYPCIQIAEQVLKFIFKHLHCCQNQSPVIPVLPQPVQHLPPTLR